MQVQQFVLDVVQKSDQATSLEQDQVLKGFENIAWIMQAGGEDGALAIDSHVDEQGVGRIGSGGPAGRTGGGEEGADHGESRSEKTFWIPPDYSLLFGPTLQALERTQRTIAILSFLTLKFHHSAACFANNFRNVLHSVLRHLKRASENFLDLQFWSIDIGSFSNSNSPKKHFSVVYKVFGSVRKIHDELAAKIPQSFGNPQSFWGHDEEAGFFTNTTIIYRDLFPNSALVDRGVLRAFLRLVGRQVLDEGDTRHGSRASSAPTETPGSDAGEEGATAAPRAPTTGSDVEDGSSTPRKLTVGDFGSLDGQYSTWLNDTGVFAAYPIEASSNVDQLTENRVSFGDLTQPLEPQLPEWLVRGPREDMVLTDGAPGHGGAVINRFAGFDYVLCIEVAEHIPSGPPQNTFLENLNRFARKGLVISWAPPWVEGEGHVSTMAFEESRRLIETKLPGMRLNEAGTRLLREGSEISWIKETVALYEREEQGTKNGDDVRSEL